MSSRLALVTLFAVRLEALRELWTGEPLERAVASVPRGRLAALVGPPVTAPFHRLDGVDRAQPPARLLLSLGIADTRRLWDALLEDRAVAALYDAPALTLADVFGAIASVAQRRELESMRLEQAAEPAYPPELLEPAGASGPISVGGRITFKVWMGAPTTTIAKNALASALSLPVGAFPTGDPVAFRDVAESLAPVLEAAARPRHSLVATRGESLV